MYRLKYLNNCSDILKLNNSSSYFLNFQNSRSLKTFDEAQAALKTVSEEPDNTTKLRLYALFKQATEGKCEKKKPSMMDFIGKAKWEAWMSLKDLSKESAELEYIRLVKSMLPKGTEAVPTGASKSSTPGLDISTSDLGVMMIKLNRIDKKNAITWEMYNAWADALNGAGNNPKVKVVAITGAGEYFCSGNDLSNFTKSSDIPKMIKEAKATLHKFVKSFIDFPKPLVGLINGPAIGISVTTLALYDMVIASDKATFSTPFPNLGQTPEGCSSYTFPMIMGPSKASSMLLFNEKMSAKEALNCGFVGKVFNEDDFERMSQDFLEKVAAQPPKSTLYAKELIRKRHTEVLHEVNTVECERLGERWGSDECMNAISAFFMKK